MFHLIPWRNKSSAVDRPHHPLEVLRQDFDTLFDRLFGQSPFGEFERRSWGIDTDENDKEYVVKFEVPGFETDELDVNVNQNQLTVQAEHKSEGDNGKSYSKFQKSVLLPNTIDAEKIEAKYRNGVLEVRVPKKPEAAGRRIEVQS